MKMNFLLTPQKATQLIDTYLLSLPCETINIKTAFYRVIDHCILATLSQPPFTKSAMDGFAYYSNDLSQSMNKPYKICSDMILGAGQIFNGILAPDECIRIMTGAKVPSCYNAVHRIEYTTLNADQTVSFIKLENSRNIIDKGKNQVQGSVLLTPRILKSFDISLLASSGIATVKVTCFPRIGIISTGDELLSPDQEWNDGCIFDSNSYLLTSFFHSLNIPSKFYGIVKDNEDSLKTTCMQIFKECDIIIFSGGVSMGDFDYLPKILSQLNVQTIIHGVKLKPGKPMYFGYLESKAIFGLPGNPISSFVCFELFVKPYLYRSMGIEYQAKEFLVPLTEEYRRKDSSREEYIPAQLIQENGILVACLLPYYGSSMLSVLSEANILIRINIGISQVKKGELIYARFISERD